MCVACVRGIVKLKCHATAVGAGYVLLPFPSRLTASKWIFTASPLTRPLLLACSHLFCLCWMCSDGVSFNGVDGGDGGDEGVCRASADTSVHVAGQKVASVPYARFARQEFAAPSLASKSVTNPLSKETCTGRVNLETWISREGARWSAPSKISRKPHSHSAFQLPLAQ